MAFCMASEYAAAALLVALAVWKLAPTRGSTRSHGIRDVVVQWPLELWSLVESTPFMLAMLAAFAVCLSAMDNDRRAPRWPRAAPS